jgi:hypothetical protein
MSTVIAPPKRGVFVNAILGGALLGIEILVANVSVVIDCARCGCAYMCSCCEFDDGRVW